MNPRKKIIFAGIDLGTCFSSSSIYENDIIQLVKTKGMAKENKPSVVRYDKDGTILVGYEAKIQAYKYTKQTVFNSKRLLGIQYSDPIVQKSIENSTVEIINKDNYPYYRIINKFDGKEIVIKKPSEISTDILKSIREDIVHSGALDNEIPEVYCVITVPAYFTQEQRAETKKAAENANLNVLALLNEPSAAIIYYAYRKKIDRNMSINHSSQQQQQQQQQQQSSPLSPFAGMKTYLVCDIGGGTTDLTIAKFSNDEPIKVIGYGGDTFLGGEDITYCIMDYVIKQTKEKFNVDLGAMAEKKPKLKHQLYNRCEEAKIRLSGGKRMSVEVDVTDLGGFDEKEMDEEDDEYEEEDDEYYIELTGDTFIKICKDIFDRIILCLDKFFVKLEGQINKSEIDCVIMVGGSSNIPSIIDLVKDYFGGSIPMDHSSDTEVVARGASIYANNLGQQKNLSNYCQEEEEEEETSPLPQSSSPSPDDATKNINEATVKCLSNINTNKDQKEEEEEKEKEKEKENKVSTTTTNNNNNNNNDSSSNRKKGGAIIEDVVSMNLGVESGGLSFSCIIPSGTVIPTEKPFECAFYTSVDYQTQLSFNIFEGDSSCVLYNTMIGSLIVPDIPSELAGHVCVNVVFQIDESNILHATAYEKPSSSNPKDEKSLKQYSTSIDYQNKGDHTNNNNNNNNEKDENNSNSSNVMTKRHSKKLVEEINKTFTDSNGKFNEELFKKVFTSRRNLRYLCQELREKLKEKIATTTTHDGGETELLSATSTTSNHHNNENDNDLKSPQSAQSAQSGQTTSPIESVDSANTKTNTNENDQNHHQNNDYSISKLYQEICNEHYALSHNPSKMFSSPEYFNNKFRDYALVYLMLQTMGSGTEIIINENSLNGTLTPLIGHFSTLTVLNLSNNGLTGLIPSSIGNLKNLQILDLSHNSFNGNIPESLCNLVNLIKLNLNNNNLSGSIPNKIENLIHLEILNLKDNKFDEEIPLTIEKLKELSKLDLSKNLMKGKLSTSFIERFIQDSIILDEDNVPNKEIQ